MNNTLKRFLTIFLYTIFVIYIFYLGEVFLQHLRQQGQRTLTDYWLVAIALFPIMMGLIIALPKFLREAQKDGDWEIDWVKLIAIGIPVLYLTIFPLVFVLPFLSTLYPYPIHRYLPNNVSGVVLGYLVLSVMHKKIL